MRHSIIRRSLPVVGAYLLGHGFNYALMLAANRILGNGGFGLFYSAVLAVTVAMAPLTALTLVLGRTLTSLGAEKGTPALIGATNELLGRSIWQGVPLALAAGALFAPLALVLRMEAWQILALVPATVLALIVVEVIRTAFQSLLLFRWSSAVWVVSQAAQFLMAVAGLLVLGSIWAGICGILLGSALTAGAFSAWFLLRRIPVVKQSDFATRLFPAKDLPSVASYALFVLINNMDLLVGYWILPRAALDSYAASALLPKGIITATFPIAQIILPVIVERYSRHLSVSASIFKGLLMATSCAAAAACVLWYAVPILQQSPLAIRGLDVTTLRLLSIGAVALGAARIAVVTEIALKGRALTWLQALIVVLFVVLAAMGTPTIDRLAFLYVVVAWLLFAGTALFALSLMRQKSAAAKVPAISSTRMTATPSRGK